MAATVAVVALRAIVAEVPNPTPRERVIINECRSNLLVSLGIDN
jgi:hypothetical protein